jgi:hypothetical protein
VQSQSGWQSAQHASHAGGLQAHSVQKQSRHELLVTSLHRGEARFIQNIRLHAAVQCCDEKENYHKHINAAIGLQA